MRWSCIAAAAFLLLSSISAAPAAEMNAALRELVDAANKEGALTLSWSQSTFGGEAGAEMAEARMNKLFGSKIHIEFLPGTDMARVGSQLATEYQAGQKAYVDIFMGAALQTVPLIKVDFFAPVDWTRYLPERIRPDIVELDGKVVRIVTGLGGAIYNSQLAPMKPTSLDDFLRPEWQGRIASTPYAASFDVLLADDVWGEAKTVAYVRALSRQIGGLIRCGEEERLATGEYIALVMDCTGQGAALMRAKGAPLEQMMPRDAGQERYYYFAVPKHAQHPNAAKLFVVFMLTEEGQAFAWETWRLDLSSLPGSHTGEAIAAYEKQGVKFIDVSVNWWLSHPEIDAKKDRLVQILATKN